MYYEIDEAAAKRANDMNSFSDYVARSETAEYRKEIDRAVKLTESRKARVSVYYHKKLDRLLDSYCRRLAARKRRAVRNVPRFCRIRQAMHVVYRLGPFWQGRQGLVR